MGQSESLGLLTRRAYRQLLRYLRWILDFDFDRELAPAEREKLIEMLAPHGLYWWEFYEHPLHVHVGVLMRLIGLEEGFEKAAHGPDGARSAYEYLFSEAESDDFSSISAVDPKQLSLVANALIALRYSLEAACYFKATINELVAMAKKGEQEALVKAARIDKALLGTSIGRQALAIAQLSKDEKAKADLLGGKPHKKLRKYRDLRFMVRVLEEARALEGGVTQQVIDLIVRDLGLHTESGGDAAKNVRDLIRILR